MQTNYPVEIRFPVLGAKLKIDHGYNLYAAIKKHICDNYPELLTSRNIPMDTRIATIKGTNLFNGYLQIKSFSRLRIRCDIKYAYELINALDNQLLGLAGGSVFVQSGYVKKLTPCDSLQARLVVIKYPNEAEITYHSGLLEKKQNQFIESCYKQLKKHEIQGTVQLVKREEKPIIGSITVDKPPSRQSYLGYGVNISGLTDQDSLKLQMVGIGGKRHFGCGWFDPVRQPVAQETIQRDLATWED